jgi:hypothetical protein
MGGGTSRSSPRDARLGASSGSSNFSSMEGLSVCPCGSFSLSFSFGVRHEHPTCVVESVGGGAAATSTRRRRRCSSGAQFDGCRTPRSRTQRQWNQHWTRTTTTATTSAISNGGDDHEGFHAKAHGGGGGHLSWRTSSGRRRGCCSGDCGCYFGFFALCGNQQQGGTRNRGITRCDCRRRRYSRCSCCCGCCRCCHWRCRSHAQGHQKGISVRRRGQYHSFGGQSATCCHHAGLFCRKFGCR